MYKIYVSLQKPVIRLRKCFTSGRNQLRRLGCSTAVSGGIQASKHQQPLNAKRIWNLSQLHGMTLKMPNDLL